MKNNLKKSGEFNAYKSLSCADIKFIVQHDITFLITFCQITLPETANVKWLIWVF